MRYSRGALATVALSLSLAGGVGCVEPSPFANRGEPRHEGARPTPATPPSPVGATSPNALNVPTAPAATASAPTVAGVPPDAHRGGAVFANALEVAAYKIDPPEGSAGQEVTVTAYLRVLGPLTDDDMMFVHVDDSSGHPVRVNADHWPANHARSMSDWKKGDIVRDQFSFVLNGFEGSQAATVWLGFYNPAREDRMAITNASAVRNDNNNRYALADIPIH